MGEEVSEHEDVIPVAPKRRFIRYALTAVLFVVVSGGQVFLAGRSPWAAFAVSIVGYGVVVFLVLGALERARARERALKKRFWQSCHFTSKLVEALPDPVYIADARGNYRGGNRAFWDAVGLDARPKKGVSLESLSGSGIQRVATLHKEGQSGGGKTFEPVEVKLVSKSGEKHPYILTQTALTSKHEGSVMVLGVLSDISEQKERQRQTRALTLILSAAGEGIFGLDSEGRIVFVNPTAASLLGYQSEDLIGQHALELVRAEDSSGRPIPHSVSSITKAYQEGRAGKATDEVFRTRTNDAMPVKYIVTPIQTRSALEGAVVIFSDTTVTRQQEQELQQIRAALDDTSDAVLITSNRGKLVYVNRAYGALFNCTPQKVESINIADAHADGGEFDTLFRAVIGGERVSRDVKMAPRKGDPFPAHVRGTAIFDEHSEIIGALFLYTDITEQKHLEHELFMLSQKDGLTGIANRRAFDTTLESEWRRARREKSSLSLFMIDIDAFKLYNDHYGHQEGDACLKQVAKALDEAFQRPGDFVARYGGEEFAIIVANGDAEGVAGQGEHLRRVVEAMNIPHEKSPASEFVTVSMGLATVVPGGESSVEGLIKAADEALYRAKDEGRNKLCLAADSA